jgi:sarcosine oxidase subunit alpha
MSGPTRIPGADALIDRTKTLDFTFDGRRYQGHPGDTLASALLANGVRLMGRGFKYHRPRGVLSAGSDEPNALVTLRSGARAEPNTRATVIEVFEGLEATSQNRWPSLSLDLMAVNDLVAPALTAGFYYKTFMWPKGFWERVYEPIIRRAAGLGALSMEPDPDAYDKASRHCDLLVIGAGPAGLTAALTAGRAGARVILADEDFELGGRLITETHALDEGRAADWVARARAELDTLPSVRVMTRTTVFGAFDHGVYGALERVSDHLPAPPAGRPRQTLWRIQARRAVLCAGATERMIAFPDNDRPGILLAGAARAYLNRWDVAVGGRVAVFTNNDDGHRTALDLLARGGQVAGVIDVRPDAPRLGDYALFAGARVVGSSGRLGLSAITVARADGRRETLDCGALAVSGGWNPAIGLTGHQRGRPVWREDIAAFCPGPDLPPGLSVAGAAAGDFSTYGALSGGARAATEALADLDIKARPFEVPKAEDAPVRLTPYWCVPHSRGRAWLDPQNDVTVKDVKLAHQEGFRSVEHLKRYTTLGMATDQGKAANMGALAILAELSGCSIPEVGTTMMRPPHTPVAVAAFAGCATGADFRPVRRTPTHAFAEERGATFTEAGLWLRAQWFPRPGETHWRQSVDREVLAVRAGVGVCDVTTLGKVDVQGADAATFLNLLYCNGMKTLAVGKVRYGLMLREDGFAMDDGTVARLGEDHYVVTTTTAKAVPVYRHMEFVRQCLCPALDVQLISTTEAWAQLAIAGPRARDLLARVVDAPFDLSNEAFPFMACAALTVCGGTRARLFRISFSGELAYELAVPTRYGDSLMRVLMAAGADLGVTPYGTEALSVLRIEKGHAAGGELNGQTSPAHLGMARMVSTRKDSIGAVLSRRPALLDEDGPRLVGLKATRPDVALAGGAHLFSQGTPVDAAHDQGHVTSAAFSPHLGRAIALALLKRGEARHGEIIRVANPVEGVTVEAEVTSPHFIDPEGGRLRV